MAHEIQTNDNVVLHKQPAWHGLGICVEEAPTPREALTIGGIGWGVDQREIYTKDKDGKEVKIDCNVANYRADTGDLLGVVSNNYRVIQNVEVADFCEALLEEGEVRCETVGTIRNGAMVWFLLKGEEFQVAKGDQLMPYILVSNGHDGGTTFRVTPTTVRVVCSNTLHMTIPRYDEGQLGESAISIRHTVNIMERLEEARRALQHYNETLDEHKVLINVLSKKDVTKEEVQKFFLECYTADFGEVPENPKTKVEENRRNRALSAYNSFSRRWDDEIHLTGPTWYLAMNSYSGLVQHDLKARGQTDEDRVAKRVESNLFGLNSYRTQEAMKRAFKYAVA